MAGTIRKRTRKTRKGEILVRWEADYFDQTRKRRVPQFKTRKEAVEHLAKATQQIREGVFTPDAESITVAEAARLWLDKRRPGGLEAGSRRTYGGHLAYILPDLGKIKLSRLTKARVESFADQLAEKLSWQRATHVLSALKMILNTALDRDLVGRNVAARVKMTTDRRGKRRLAVGVDVPTKAEVQAIIAAATGRARPRMLTLIFAGLRASELRGLTWNAVDLDKGVLSVRQRADWWGTIGHPKSGAGHRDIPLPPLALNTLREWRLASRHTGAADLVFPGHGGRPMNHTSLQGCFSGVQQVAGVVDEEGGPKYTLHALRHFFASWRIEQRTDPKRLQELMGHSSIRMTYDTYGHWIGSVADERARLAADEAAVLRPV